MAKKIVAKKKVVKKAVAKKPKAKVSVKKTAPKSAKKSAPKAKAVKSLKVVKAVKKEAPKPAPKPLVAIPKKPVLIVPKNDATKQYTQGELLDCITGYCGFRSKKEAKEFYEGFAAMIQEGLKAGYKLMLPGLGKIQVKRTAPRMGRNPMTGAEIKIPAKKKVRFNPLKSLRDAVL